MNRRGFLGGLLGGCLAVATAPYIMSNGVASGILMPVRDTKIWSRIALADTAGFLRIYSGVPPPDPNEEPIGGLLVSLAVPKDRTHRPMEALVQQTGTARWAQLDHSIFGRHRFKVACSGAPINLYSTALVTGDQFNMQTFEIRDTNGLDLLA